MALDAAAGPISKSIDRLKTTLEATAEWQAIAGSIYFGHLPEPVNKRTHTKAEIVALRPFAILWTTDGGYGVKRTTSGGGTCVEHSGKMILRIERNVTAGKTPEELDREWENIIGRLVKQTAGNPGLIDLAADPQYLPITEVQMLDHSRTDPSKIEAIGDAQRALLLIQW